LPVPKIDNLLGIEVYATKSKGIGGFIRGDVEDFVVEEILVDGSKATVNDTCQGRVLNSISKRQHFLVCVLVKRNWDTFIAVKNIAEALGVEQGSIQFAGIKDAKAITAQFITIENVSIDDVKKVSIKDITLNPLGYFHDRLSLFYLLGNNFTIVIKNNFMDQTETIEALTQTMNELETFGGIPNFFGHQRFGTTRPITHLVGKAISQGNFQEAAMLFLAKDSPYEHSDSKRVRQELHVSRDFKQALQSFPKQLRFERLMVNHLVEKPNDYVGAFKRLPSKLQALFVQAHQSYLFNRFLSQRLKHGLHLNEAIAGDFVLGVDRSGLPLNTMVKTVNDENLDQTNEKIKRGKMRVALPIFGAKQNLSKGFMGEIERDVLSTEELSEEPPYLNDLSRIGGKGGLRALVAPVSDFKFQEPLENSINVQFMLFRGCYATILLREIMKPYDPIISGF
jgi:tRNA pseudouridine13 synthase